MMPSSATDSRRYLQTQSERGGAIQSYGSTMVSESRFENCTARLEGGAVYVGSGTASFLKAIFRGNSAFEGGGIFVSEGDLTVQDSTFSNNVATNTNGSPDVLAQSGVQLDVCGNTGGSDDLTGECSATVVMRSVTWTALASIGLLAAWCM